MGRSRRHEHGGAARQRRRRNADGALFGARGPAAAHQADTLRKRDRSRTRAQLSGARHARRPARVPEGLKGAVMIFSLEVRRALKGDCLLLHFGTADEPELAIIDAGPATVYKEHLLPR